MARAAVPASRPCHCERSAAIMSLRAQRSNLSSFFNHRGTEHTETNASRYEPRDTRYALRPPVAPLPRFYAPQRRRAAPGHGSRATSHALPTLPRSHAPTRPAAAKLRFLWRCLPVRPMVSLKRWWLSILVGECRMAKSGVDNKKMHVTPSIRPGRMSAEFERMPLTWA